MGGAAPDRVYALARDGAFVLTPTSWSLEIRRDALGTGYHSLAHVCATDHEVAIVDRAWGVMLSAR